MRKKAVDLNSILRKTHAKNNIDILRARDYYYNLAKSINLGKSILVFSLPTLLALSYIPFVQSGLGYSDSFRDIATGVLTLLVIAVSFVLDRFIDQCTDISNTLREYYDWKVLNIKGTCFTHDFSQIDNWLSKASKVPYRDKYEVWYAEVFSSDKNSNIFCCQLDNILYAVYSYKTTEYIYRLLLILFFGCSACVLGLLIADGNWQSALFVAFSLIECFDVLYSKISKLKESRERCTQFSNIAKQLKREDLSDATITAMQHAVIENRSLCVFLPRMIRDYFLKDNSKYLQALDQYKKTFWGDDSNLPENDTQIEVVSEDGQWGVPLSEVHSHLRTMLAQVIEVFHKENIDYILDGGTLIGAMRPSNRGFIPWDDDVDLAIPVDQVEKAKLALKMHLDYHIQDVENEQFYSPRLAAFRVREDNQHSIINEKDSSFYTKYQNRGLFLDIYAYSPVLKCIFVDKAYRMLILHPLNKRLKSFEAKYPLSKDPVRAEKKFLKLKARYMRWLRFYRKHANNNLYCVYSPEYIHTYNCPGPYLPREALFGQTRYTEWEGLLCRIPVQPEEVLKSYYGEDWETSPFPTKEMLREAYGEEWYSKAKLGITCLKHISNIVFADNTYTKNENNPV